MKPKKPTRVKTTADARHQHRTHLSLEAIRRELTPQERHEWNLIHDADLAAELEDELSQAKRRFNDLWERRQGELCNKNGYIQIQAGKIAELEQQNADLKEVADHDRIFYKARAAEAEAVEECVDLIDTMAGLSCYHEQHDRPACGDCEICRARALRKKVLAARAERVRLENER